MTTITIKSGQYRNQQIENQTFKMISGFKQGPRGGYVTVEDGDRRCHIRVEREEDIIMGTVPEVEESDAEVLARIGARFKILDDMTAAAARGEIRAMIVSGPPGVGKSFGVERQLNRYSVFEYVSDQAASYEVVKGAITPIGLYATLYRHSDPGHVVVFDDCDSVLHEPDSLNLLKGALDSGRRRRISWNSDSHYLRRSGIPETFDFKGAVIFITNLDLTHTRSKKLQDHLEALRSRCHYLDLTMRTERDKILRIRQIFEDGELFRDYAFDEAQGEEIINYVIDNRNRLSEISIRMCLKIADLTRVNSDWQALAEATCMKKPK